VFLRASAPVQRNLESFSTKTVIVVVAANVGCFALNSRFTTNGMCAKNNTLIYVARTSNNRVIAACDLYCCLLPQCGALSARNRANTVNMVRVLTLPRRDMFQKGEAQGKLSILHLSSSLPTMGSSKRKGNFDFVCCFALCARVLFAGSQQPELKQHKTQLLLAPSKKNRHNRGMQKSFSTVSS